MAYSYSRLSRYLDCPLSFKKEYIDKEAGRVSEALLVGRITHDITDGYVKHLIEKQLETDISVVTEMTNKAYYKNNLGLNHYSYDDVLNMMCRFVEHFKLNLQTIFESEIQIGIDRDGRQVDFFAKNIWFRGKIDRLDIDDNQGLIADYKTNRAIEVDSWQTEIYAWLLSLCYPSLETFKVQFHFLRFNEIKEFHVGPEEIKKAEAKVRGTVKLIEEEKEWKARPGNNCGYCPYSEKCEAVKELGELGIVNKGDAESVAGQILVLEKQISDRKKALKAWVGEEGPVTLNTGAFDFWPSTQQTIEDLEEFCKMLSKREIDPYGYLNLDGNKNRGGALFKKFPELEPLKVESKSTSFKFKKGANKK